jgi:hypothetical protein
MKTAAACMAAFVCVSFGLTAKAMADKASEAEAWARALSAEDMNFWLWWAPVYVEMLEDEIDMGDSMALALTGGSYNAGDNPSYHMPLGQMTQQQFDDMVDQLTAAWEQGYFNNDERFDSEEEFDALIEDLEDAYEYLKNGGEDPNNSYVSEHFPNASDDVLNSILERFVLMANTSMATRDDLRDYDIPALLAEAARRIEIIFEGD